MERPKKNKNGRNYSQDGPTENILQDRNRSMVQANQANNILPDQQNNISSGGALLGGRQSRDKPCISSALETRGQGDGREETRPSESVQEADVFRQYGVPHGLLVSLIRMMLQWLQQENRNHQQWVQEENQEQLQRLHQENRNHQQRVQNENKEQLQRIKQENRDHQQRVQDENQEQLQRIKQENRNHQQRVQEENQEQLQRIKQENRNHQQWVQDENQEQLQRIKQENRNHQQRVQEENQEQLQRIKQENRNHQQRVQGGNQEQWIKWENRNHQLWMQSKERKQHNQMQQENQEHFEQQLRQLRQERIKDLQLKQKENLNMHKPITAKSFVMEPHWKQRDGADYSDEGGGDICCMCRKCKCYCHIHDKQIIHGVVKDKHELAATMERDTGHHRMVPRDKDIDKYISIEESRHVGRNDITGKVDTTFSVTNGVSDSDIPKGESNVSTKKTHQYPDDGTSAVCGGNPEDPSDGSDSEDDSKKDRGAKDDDSKKDRTKDEDSKKDLAQDDREEIDLNKDGNKEDTISGWRIDTKVWKVCIEMKNVQEANRLLNERILPDQELLDRGLEVFGISSKIVQNICAAICCYMKENFLHINHVCPALDYRHELSNKQITFVIYRARPHENEAFEYRYYIRHINEISTSCSEENEFITELEQDVPKEYAKTEKVVECLNKNSKSLMEQHTNLTRVSIGWFKSKGFATKHQNITQKTCIVLYVQVKGFVPLNETALPEVIDGIDVDVRECVVLPYTFPNEHHEHIKMGCAIHGGLRNAQGRVLGGTLGGFFEVGGEMYCITSAHTFMSPADMGKLNQCGKFCDLGPGNDIETFEAHQPVVEGSRSFGKGVRAVYKEGGNGEAGVEAVVIKVQDRFPVSGEFPACPYRRNPGIDRPNFSTGKMCNREEVNRLIRSKTLTVVKFGCSSGWTRGSFRFSAGAARWSNMVGSIHNFGILLHNQFEIENIGETLFAEFGDSGALVFTDENNELSVIGTVEGGTPGVIYVTPICDVFSALELQNVQSTKEFTLHYQDIQNIPMEIRSDSYSSRTITDRSDSGISTNDDAVLKHIEEKFKTFDQEITQEVARHVQEIKQNMNTRVNQELRPVKSELNTLKTEVTLLKSDITNIKSEVEKTKSELKQDIDKSNTEIQSKMNVMQEQFKAQLQEQTNSIKNMLSEFFRPNPAANASNTNLHKRSSYYIYWHVQYFFVLESCFCFRERL
ncbi:uncharacterized protein LOC123559853 isoform X2 [Mercenaria mercenaria]|uniref:uncharacterized protein LOC123559853 isoform X2 n=1 Tax=Mercenaria mercenaria TaxID=6596 RepID=UPI00234EC6DD|nr:uncharacterized protein LOC123559853 isoform X2 [Mercenaria mercenaria]